MFVYFADVLFSGQLDDNIQLGRSTSHLSDANIKAGSMRSRSLKLPVSSSHADCLADLDSHGLWKWHWADGFLFYISIWQRLLYVKFYFSVVLKFVNKKESQSRGFSTVSPVKSFSWSVMGRDFSAISSTSTDRFFLWFTYDLRSGSQWIEDARMSPA